MQPPTMLPCSSNIKVTLLRHSKHTLKAFMENHFQMKMKELQDDKGGEYMSAAFIKFTDTCGIYRCHTTRNQPQQNGVAECANRIMADDISAMLFEAKLPLSL